MSSLLKMRADRPFTLASSPHVHSPSSVSSIFLGTLAALFPIGISAVIFFGLEAIRVLFLTVASAIAFETLFRWMFGKRFEFRNGSTVLAAVLLAFLLPPELPWWMIVVTSFVTVIMGKEIFGGLGQNVFQPSLVGFAASLVLASYGMGSQLGVQESSSRTFLDTLRLFFVQKSNMIGGGSIFAIVISGLIAAFKKWISWRTAVLYLLTLGLISLVLSRDPLTELLSGGVFLCAFFLVTDSVTNPITKGGRIFYALSTGVLTAVLRSWTGPAQAMTSAVLLMNALSPLVDRFIRPRSWGFR